jgi:uncharacterized protein (TIGR03437 family)
MGIVLGAVACLLLTSLAVAQPVVGRVSTETIYAGGDDPQDRVVQGSVFRVDGYNLAAGEQSAAGFPLPTSLGGTSIRVMAGGRTFDAIIISTPVLQFPNGPRPIVRSVLPSKTPPGDAMLILTYNGRESAPFKILVVKRDFGLYGLVQNFDETGRVHQNMFEHAATPGQLIGLWGTGLGPVDGDEASGPLPAALTIPGLEVLVGGIAAKMAYAGRSGCCAGIDQIIVEVPRGVEGCNVAARVRYPDGDAADAPKTDFGFVSLAIANTGGECSAPFGVIRPVRYARINVSTGDPYTSSGASFRTAAGPDQLPPMGTCGWGQGWGATAYLDAGAVIHLRTPDQSVNFMRPPIPGYPQLYYSPSPGDLKPGIYTLDNGSGGNDIGPFSASFDLPEIAFAWTSQDALRVRPDASLEVTWKGGIPGEGYVMVNGLFSIGGVERPGLPLIYADYQGGFSCVERVEKGTLVVPAADMWTSFTRRADYLELIVLYVHGQEIDIAGLDLAEFIYSRGGYKAIKLR